MKKIKSQEDFKEIRTCDIHLISMKWIENGRDLEFEFFANENEKSNFVCTWANNMDTSLSTKPNHGGYPLTWDITLKVCENETIEVKFDFASTGYISVTCNDLIYYQP